MKYDRNGALISKKYFQFFWPTLLMVFSSTFALTVDSLIVSRMLGPTSMSAVNACMPLMQLYATFGVWIGLGASSTIVMIYYYTAIQNQKMSLLLSLSQGLIVVVPICYLGSYFFGISGVFGGFIAANFLTLLMILLPIGKEGWNILSLGQEPVLLELSLKGDNIHEVNMAVLSFLKQQEVEEKLAVKIGISIEEYYELLKQINEKAVHMDVVIKKYEESFVVSMVDDGKPCDLLVNEEKNENIRMLRSISEGIEYKYVIGLNRIQCSFKRQKNS